MALEYLEDKKKLNQVQYSAMDFPTFFDSLLRRIKTLYSGVYNDFGSTSVGVMLVHIMAYGLSQLSWYLDRRTSDLYLETARSLSSITKLARQIGYKVTPATSSTVDLTLSFPALTTDVVFPKGFRFQGPNSLTFESTSIVNISQGATSATVNVSEGIGRVSNFTSDGTENQVFQLLGVLEEQYIADQSVVVYVNGLEWAESDFLSFDKTNQFEVIYTESPPEVRFGDGLAGNIPPNNAEVRIEYRIISGANGNVNANTITSAIDTFLVQTNPVTLTISHSAGSSGGADPQSLEEIRNLAPKYFAARKSAITLNDYNTLANSFVDPTYGSPSKAYAYTVRSSSIDATLSNLTQSIIGYGNSTAASVSSSNTTVDGLTDSISSNSTSADAKITSSIASVNSVVSDQNTIKAQCILLTGASATLDATKDQATDELTAMLASMDAMLLAGTLSATNYTTLEGHRAKVASFVSSLSSVSSSVTGSATSIRSSANSSTTAASELTTDLTSAQTSVQSIAGDLASIDSNLAALNTSATANSASTSSDIGSINTYLTGLFSADAEANVVSVPIVAKDAGGFYTGPSSGLLSALQKYLNGVKEVTHDVRVVSGALGLLPAVINIKYKVLSKLVESEVVGNITAAVDNVLRDREFNSALYLSELYSSVSGISGIDYINIEITGPEANLDISGNLIPEEFQVVTKGSVNLTAV
jgi:hypothetical protein